MGISNGNIFNGINTVNLPKSSLYGFKKKFYLVIKKRFDYKNLNELFSTKVILLLLYTVVPKNKTVSNKKLLKIYFLDFIGCYRGWRHVTGLPVRGQRTWSNA